MRKFNSNYSHVHVVGGGLAALEAARRLHKQGHKICLVRGPKRPFSATWAAQGLSSVKGIIEPQSPLFAAKLSGHYRIRPWIDQLQKDTGIQIPTIQGAYESFGDQNQFSQRLDRAHHRRSLAMTRAYILENRHLPAELSCALQTLKGPVLGAIYYPDDLYFEVHRLIEALETYATKHFELIHRDVHKVVFDGENSPKLLLSDHNLIPVKDVLIAAGTESLGLLPFRFGTEVIPVAGHTLSFRDRHLSDTVKFNVLLIEGKHSLSLCQSQLSYASSSIQLNKDRGIQNWQEVSKKSLLGDFAHYFSSYNLKGEDEHSERKFLPGIRWRSRDRYPLCGPILNRGRPTGVSILSGLHKSGFQLIHSCMDILCARRGSLVASNAMLIDEDFRAKVDPKRYISAGSF